MFGMLVDRYQQAFLRKSRSMLRSDELSEDAVQEAFLKIYKYAYTFKEQDGAKFSSWAYKILTNTCYSLSAQKTARQAQVTNMDFADLDVVSSTSEYAATERVSFVRSILSRIPTNLSRVLSLYFFEEKSYEEIASAEHLSLSAVKSRLHRAKKEFKNLAIKMI